MSHLNSNGQAPNRQTRRRMHSLALTLGSAFVAAAPLMTVATAATMATSTTAVALPAVAPALQSDKIFSVDKKTDKVKAASGTVTEAELGGVKFEARGGKNTTLDATSIVLIQWGAAPSSFTDGETYAERGEWESAVTNFQSAATDSDARPCVQAAARLRSIESMIEWGASEPARFTDAIAEADRFLADHGTNWAMPKARSLKARAAWLGGDAAGARDGYKQLFEAGKDGADGYSPIAVAEAALSAGEAALSSPETSTARELFDAAASAFAAIDSTDPKIRARAAAGEEVARMASAKSLLAKGDHAGAAGAFESALGSAKTSAGKGAARLGLGLALLGKGELQEAQIQLGWVAGLDHTSSDRRAAALLGLGQALLGAEGGATLAKASLQRVKTEYGTSPSAAKATELLSTL